MIDNEPRYLSLAMKRRKPMTQSFEIEVLEIERSVTRTSGLPIR